MCPNEPEKKKEFLFNIAEAYTWREYLAELLERPLLDTHSLDTLLFNLEELPSNLHINLAFLDELTEEEFNLFKKIYA